MMRFYLFVISYCSYIAMTWYIEKRRGIKTQPHKTSKRKRFRTLHTNKQCSHVPFKCMNDPISCLAYDHICGLMELLFRWESLELGKVKPHICSSTHSLEKKKKSFNGFCLQHDDSSPISVLIPSEKLLLSAIDSLNQDIVKNLY